MPADARALTGAGAAAGAGAQVFKGKGPVDGAEIERMFAGLRYAPLKDIDPNPRRAQSTIGL